MKWDSLVEQLSVLVYKSNNNAIIDTFSILLSTFMKLWLHLIQLIYYHLIKDLNVYLIIFYLMIKNNHEMGVKENDKNYYESFKRI